MLSFVVAAAKAKLMCARSWFYIAARYILGIIHNMHVYRASPLQPIVNFAFTLYTFYHRKHLSILYLYWDIMLLLELEMERWLDYRCISDVIGFSND